MDGGAMLTLDGSAGYGQVMGFEAMELGAEALGRKPAVRGRPLSLAPSGASAIGPNSASPMAWCSIHFVNVLARPIVAPLGGRDAPATAPARSASAFRARGQRPDRAGLRHQQNRPGKTRVAYNKGEQLAPNIHHRRPRQPRDRPALP